MGCRDNCAYENAPIRYRDPGDFPLSSDYDHARVLTAIKVVILMVIAMLSAFGVAALMQILAPATESADADIQDAGLQEYRLEDTSTPKEEWRRGEMPYIYQIDPEWADRPYAGETIATSGCGPTCAAMVYVYLTGKKDKGPVEMASLSTKGHYVEGGLTTWGFINEGLANIGVDVCEVSADGDLVKSHLLKGEPVICSVRKGDFTTEGHFIVLCGINSNGSIEIRDPNSYERSHKGWDVERIIGQCANIWACRNAG